MKPARRHIERHRTDRVGWLRAAVLGANDGIVSTASLIAGVAAAHASHGVVLTTGLAGLVAGAMSMAAGEYVSVHSQADTEAADLSRERTELVQDPRGDCVRYLMGVIAVDNNLTIKPSVKWIDVKTKIEDAFRRNADIEARRITVGTHDGKVTLTGSVASWTESDEAVSAAWAAPGVTSVRNELLIAP
jgi:osmotically-inducible protein OsmY